MVGCTCRTACGCGTWCRKQRRCTVVIAGLRIMGQLCHASCQAHPWPGNSKGWISSLSPNEYGSWHEKERPCPVVMGRAMAAYIPLMPLYWLLGPATTEQLFWLQLLCGDAFGLRSGRPPAHGATSVDDKQGRIMPDSSALAACIC